MDKKSLLTGMCLGAAIAFSGMILGGLGQNQGMDEGPRDGVQRFDQLIVGELQVTGSAQVLGGAYIQSLASRKFNIINARGLPMIEMEERQDLGTIQINDGNRDAMVRIGGILRGGGHIQTLYGGKPATEIGSTPLGGMVTVRGLTDRSGARIWVMPGNGGTFVLQNPEGETSTIFPGFPPEPEPREENHDGEDPNNDNNKN